MIKGIIYEERSSANKNAELLILDEKFSIKENDSILFDGYISDLDISPRIGNIERKIKVQKDIIFATKENDLIDKLILKKTKKSNFIHTFESNFFLILLSFIATIIFSFSFIKWGIPYTSKIIAYSLPVKVNKLISTNTLNVLDKYIFKKSILSDKEKLNIESSFKNDILSNIKNDENFKYKLHFREWKIEEENIPNAFALPSGDIILTDEFIKLSSNKDEINSVLLHEIAHIKKRHSLQNIISSSFIAFIVMHISGDIQGIADLGIGLGSIFINNGYSKHYESEADSYAFKKMLQLKIDPLSFASILNKMTKKDEEIIKENKVLDYFSSHPTTKKRSNIAKKYSECFKKDLQNCMDN